MDSYSALVKRICNVPQLVHKIEEWMAFDNCLNLVSCADWKSQLESSDLYNAAYKHAKHFFLPELRSGVFKTQRVKLSEITHDISMNIIVAGTCRVYDRQKSKYPDKVPFSITIHKCQPLHLMGLAWTSDTDQNTVHLSDTVKVDFHACRSMCAYCSIFAHLRKLRNLNVPFEHGRPCILDIDVYDGNNMLNIFGPELKQMFPETFLAILKLELDSRYFYPADDSKEWARIGGKMLSLIAFPESNLMDKPSINLGSFQMLSAKRPATEKTEDEVMMRKKKQVPQRA